MLLHSKKVTHPNLDNSSARTRPWSRSQNQSSQSLGRLFTHTKTTPNSNLYNLALQIIVNGTHLKFVFLKSKIKKTTEVPKKQPLHQKKGLISRWKNDNWKRLSLKKEQVVRFLNENQGELKKVFDDAEIAFDFIKKAGSQIKIFNFDGI